MVVVVVVVVMMVVIIFDVAMVRAVLPMLMELTSENPIATDSPSGLPMLLMNRMYGTSAPDPPARHNRDKLPSAQQPQSENQIEATDTEYATPRDTEVKTTANSHINTRAKVDGDKSDNQTGETKDSRNQDLDEGSGGGHINRAFTKDEPQRKPPRRPGSKKPPKSKADVNIPSAEGDSTGSATNSASQTSSAVDDPESQSTQNSDGSLSGSGPLYTTENESPRAQPRRQWLSATTSENKGRNNDVHDEETEYSVPTSNRSSYAPRPLPVPDDSDETNETGVTLMQIHRNLPETAVVSSVRDRPALPPKPIIPKETVLNTTAANTTPASKKEEDQQDVEEPPYATIDKFKKSPTSRNPPTAAAEHNHDADQSGEAEDSSANESTGHKTESLATFALQPPSRRKRPRKRNKQPRAPEEDVYDGTKDYEDLEVDSGFYTDTSKTKIKRSSRLPAMKPDPNDTRYWITVSNDY
ncbi:hypothetical protein ElyMa_003681000 [Elysia marginata]|uniref:Shugoshin C-terminal domain-containing protein n=1 Tax=Elysia marginata TaxID=1093978 RepID=A0AAV4EZB0_9GAST|nr:hypothetical protein ElyMa_003681000 [Elysia marginata]